MHCTPIVDCLELVCRCFMNSSLRMSVSREPSLTCLSGGDVGCGAVHAADAVVGGHKRLIESERPEIGDGGRGGESPVEDQSESVVGESEPEG